MVSPVIFIVIPVFNEEPTVGVLIEQLSRHYQNIVIVDDGSHDRSYDICSKLGVVCLRHIINLGMGAALATGITYACNHGAEIVVTFDADGQHRVEDVEKIIAPLKEGRCDIVIGSRFLGAMDNIPILRKCILRLSSSLLYLFTRVKITDHQSGLRAYSKKALTNISFSMHDMAWALDTCMQIIRKKIPFIEVPITISYSEYSLRKGQKLGNMFKIIFDIITQGLFLR